MKMNTSKKVLEGPSNLKNYLQVPTTNTVLSGLERTFYNAGVLTIQTGRRPSIIKLGLCGDVHPIPGPTTTECPVCAKVVSNRHYRCVCEDHKQIFHAKCTRLALNTRNINTKC